MKLSRDLKLKKMQEIIFFEIIARGKKTKLTLRATSQCRVEKVKLNKQEENSHQ